MMQRRSALALLLLAGCASPPAAPPPAQAREIREQSALLDFHYAWPSEAAAIPALDRRFEADAAGQRADAIELAEQDRAARPAGAPFHGHYFTKTWETFGNGRRLLSLAAEIGVFTGGAHGNTAFEALIWDRAADAPVPFERLFTDDEALLALAGPAYCAGLDRQRAKKREETLPLAGPDWMVDCPPLAEQVIAPIDLDRDRRLDALWVLVAPYNAGPYAEGSYEVEVPVTPAMLALVRHEFAGDFEARAQPQ